MPFAPATECHPVLPFTTLSTSETMAQDLFVVDRIEDGDQAVLVASESGRALVFPYLERLRDSLPGRAKGDLAT